MKKYFFTTMIAIFLLFCSFGIQAQTNDPKLNQMELMKQFLGSWKCDIAEDTISFWDAKSYGTGLDCNYWFVSKDKVIKEGKQFWGITGKLINSSGLSWIKVEISRFTQLGSYQKPNI